MDYTKKRPLWQWIALYLVIGALVYGVVYYFFLSNRNQPDGQTTPTDQTTPNLSQATLSISASGFVPNSATITAGGTITWSNDSTVTSNVSSAPHPAHTDYPPLNLGDVAPGASVSLMFPNPGTYYFHNHLNPSQFGSIIVQ